MYVVEVSYPINLDTTDKNYTALFEGIMSREDVIDHDSYITSIIERHTDESAINSKDFDIDCKNDVLTIKSRRINFSIQKQYLLFTLLELSISYNIDYVMDKRTRNKIYDRFNAFQPQQNDFENSIQKLLTSIHNFN